MTEVRTETSRLVTLILRNVMTADDGLSQGLWGVLVR